MTIIYFVLSTNSRGDPVKIERRYSGPPNKSRRHKIRRKFVQILGLKTESDGIWLRPVYTWQYSPVEWIEIYRDSFPTEDYMEKVIRIATDIGTKENDIEDGIIVIPARKLDRVFAEAAKDS